MGFAIVNNFSYKSLSEKERSFLLKLEWWLILILLFKLAGFFTISENVAVTRVLKVIFRISMTGAVWYIVSLLKKKGLTPYIKVTDWLGPSFYSAYLLMGFASMLWSTDPGYSGLQLIMDLESFVFSFWLVQIVLTLNHHYPGSRLRLSWIIGVPIFIILAIFVIGMYTLPDEFYRLTHGGEEARLGGYFMNPNELGMLAVAGLSCFSLELLYRKTKWHLFLMMAVIFWSLIATGSRSSMIGFLLIVFFYIRFSDNKKLKIGINIGAVVSIPVIIQTIFIKQGDLEEVLSMTGRLPFWQALITEGLPKEPWKGFGFMRIAYTDAFQSVHTYAGKMTHNTFIQVLMNLGFIGLLIVGFQLYFSLKAVKNVKDTATRLFFLGTFIPIVINSFTEFGIFGETNYGILFWQILVFVVALQYRGAITIRQHTHAEIARIRAFPSIP